LSGELGGGLAVKAGVFSRNPGFISTPVLNQYVHAALNDTLNFNLPDLPINPYVAPGLQLGWTPCRQGRYGAFWLVPEIALASLFGVNPNQVPSISSLHILQWTLSQLPGSEALAAPIQRQRQGQQLAIACQLPPPQLQLGGRYVANPSPGDSIGDTYGAVNLASGLPLGLDHRFWLGFHSSLSGSINPVPLSLAGGWLSQGLLPGRPLDVLAIGFVRSSFNSQLNPGLNPEAVLELNYSFNLNANHPLQPVLQWVLNPGGTGQLNDILAAGLQLQLQF
jgi:porin